MALKLGGSKTLQQPERFARASKTYQEHARKLSISVILSFPLVQREGVRSGNVAVVDSAGAVLPDWKIAAVFRSTEGSAGVFASLTEKGGQLVT